MNIGLIGLGKMGAVHYRVLKALQREKIVSGIFVFDKKTPAVGEACGLNKVLEKSDGVIVATPTAWHKSYVDMCIQYKIPVFCEKPFTENYDEEDLYYRRWAGKRNPEGRAMIFVGYIERYNAALRRFGVMLNQVRSDPSDRILYFATRRVNSVPLDAMLGREIITDLGVHDFDMLRGLFGDIKLNGSRIIMSDGKAVFAQNLFALDGGVLCDSVISWIDTVKRREYVAYTVKKVITVDLLTQKITVMNRLNEKRDEFTEGIEPAYVELKRFVQFVQDGEPLSVPDPLGLAAQELAAEILENAEVIDV